MYSIPVFVKLQAGNRSTVQLLELKKIVMWIVLLVNIKFLDSAVKKL